MSDTGYGGGYGAAGPSGRHPGLIGSMDAPQFNPEQDRIGVAAAMTIGEGVTAQQQLIESLAKQLADFYGAVDPILRPMPTNGNASGGAAPTPNVCGVLSVINDNNTKIGMLINGLREQRRRVQL